MPKSKSQVAVLPAPSRVLFARVGWMTYYSGPQEGDERPKGGGAYNRKNLGHEVFNFAEFGGRLFGTARAKNGRVSLTRIDTNAADAKKLDDVLIIFVARQNIVGWYRNATVYAETNPSLPISAAREMRRRIKQIKEKGFKVGGYRFETRAEDATLLPTRERKQEVPCNVKGGFGQSNICYRKNSGWMNETIQYVLNYDKANLLTSPDAEVNAEEAATMAREKAAGFQSDPAIRRLVEQHAMKEARKELGKRAFHSFEDTSATKPYDLICVREGKKFFVEVKGTQMRGSSIILTKNEVEHVKANAESCILIVVHSVRLAGKRIVGPGTPDVIENWVLSAGELTANQFLWKR